MGSSPATLVFYIGCFFYVFLCFFMFFGFLKHLFTFVQLVELGVHVGHSFANSTFFSS